MTITFAIIVSILVIAIFVTGVISEQEGLAGFGIAACGLWFMFGTIIAGTTPSGSYPTSFAPAKIIDAHQTPNHVINAYIENGDELHFSQLKWQFILNAKEVMYVTGRKNLFGDPLKDCFSESETLKLNNQ